MHACSHPLTYVLEIEFRASQKLGKDPLLSSSRSIFICIFQILIIYIKSCMYVCAPFACSTLWIQKMASDALELEIYTIRVLIMEPECFGKIVVPADLSLQFFSFKKIIFLKLNYWKSKNCQIEFFKKRTAIFSLSETWV